MTSFRISASYNHHSMNPAEPQQYEIYAVVDTEAEAEAIAAMFPKSFNVFGTSMTGIDESGNRVNKGYVSAGRASLTKNGVNGGKNEAGIKRYRTMVRKIEALGFEIEWVVRATNHYSTREEFEAAL